MRTRYFDDWGWDDDLHDDRAWGDDLHDDRAWGDESWVDEMDDLFARAGQAFLAGDLVLARDAYRGLFDALLLDVGLVDDAGRDDVGPRHAWLLRLDALVPGPDAPYCLPLLSTEKPK